MKFYSIGCIVIFLCCFFFINVTIRHAKRRHNATVEHNNVKSKEIVDLLRIKNDYEKILNVFNDLDDRCKKLNVNPIPDFGGYFE